jgi:hypothetical protein
MTGTSQGEAGLQHWVDNDVVEPRTSDLPMPVGAFPDLRVLLTWAKTGRRTIGAPESTRERADGARAGLGELSIRTDADMIDADDIDE